MTTDATPAAVPVAARRPRNTLGVVALVIALFVVVAPILVWIFIAINGFVSSATFDDAVFVGVIGGFFFMFAAIGFASPLALTALILGIISQFRPGSRGPGIAAIVIGAIYSFGLIGLPAAIGFFFPGVIPGF